MGRFSRILERFFGLDYREPEHFFISQWSISPSLYLTYRLFWMVYIPAWLVADGVFNFWLRYPDNPGTQSKFFIYNTSWSYIVLSAVTIARAIAACWYHKKRFCGKLTDDVIFGDGALPIPIKILWVFNNIASGAEVTVTIAFYGHAAFGNGSLDRSTPLTDVMSINLHGISGLYVMVDLFLSATPVRLGHFLHLVIYMFTYGMFALAYQRLGGTNKSGFPGVYRDFDWNSSVTPLVGLVGLVAIFPAVWLFVYGIYRLRTFIYSKCTTKKGYIDHS